jgi:glutathione synthase/RimK-type ligase-like ATP-grasp enzyme
MTAAHVALWGRMSDRPLADVSSALGRRCRVTFLDDDNAACSVGSNPEELEVSSGGVSLCVQDATGFYFRPYRSDGMQLLVTWLDHASAVVVNRPHAMMSNSSKPYQLQLISRAGFAVPHTLVTTSVDEIQRFLTDHGTVVYKSVSGIRSIVARLPPDDARLKDALRCPLQVQEWLPGPDFRVHVVGTRTFACQIDSPADDYRYASRSGHSVAMTERHIPELEDRTLVLTQALGLSVAGADFRRRPSGEWVCFEVNPSPAFTAFDHAHGGSITAAVADLLLGKL